MGNASLSGCMAVIQKVLPPVRCTTASSEEDTLAAAASARRGSGWESSTGGDLVGSEAGLGAATREADAGSSSSGRSLMALHGAKEGDAHTADSAHVHNPDEAAAHFAGGSSGNGGGSSASTGRKSRRKRVETGAATEDGGSAGAGHSGDGAGSSGLHCTLLGAFLPTLHGRFVAVENFAWTASALGLPEGATLRQLRDVGEDFCARHWSVLHAQYSSHIPDQVGWAGLANMRRLVACRIPSYSCPYSFCYIHHMSPRQLATPAPVPAVPVPLLLRRGLHPGAAARALGHRAGRAARDVDQYAHGALQRGAGGNITPGHHHMLGIGPGPRHCGQVHHARLS